MCHILLIDGREKMKLIIAEKKELAEAIVAAIPGDKKYNGNSIIVGDYITCWIYGHVLAYKEPEEIDPSISKLPAIAEPVDQSLGGVLRPIFPAVFLHTPLSIDYFSVILVFTGPHREGV